MNASHGALHHVELWVRELDTAEHSLGWLLLALGYEEYERWGRGVSYRLGATYIVLEASPAVRGEHDRKRAGLNHLAFHVNTADEVESLVRKAAGQGWTLMFADRHPHAAGPDRHVAYLEDPDGFEVELVARDKTAEP
ncbi:VOC family protein [Nocardiopsis alba]|uniref:VOC family protein n=1 Tax=Nocardiopsis alba TaxID=53437 RepID=UPI00340ACF24